MTRRKKCRRFDENISFIFTNKNKKKLTARVHHQHRTMTHPQYFFNNIYSKVLIWNSFQLFGNDDIVGYEMSPSSLDLFADDKKGQFAKFTLFWTLNLFLPLSDDSQSRSDLMTYQPSPYNNSLDLNELLQNVGDMDNVHAG